MSGKPEDGRSEAWEPLLEGELAAAAGDAVESIVAGLAARIADDRGREPDEEILSPLASGPSGVALFFAYAHLAFPERGLDDLCLERLRASMASVAADRFGPSLFSGFTGVGWLLRHLEGRVFEAGEDLGAEVEETLLQTLDFHRGVWPAELISGLSGFGLYFLERLPGEAARRGAEEAIAQLAARAKEDSGALAWFTPPEGVPGNQKEIYPQGCFNLGVSHGIPGVVGFLAAAHRHGVMPDEARRLADGAVRWLLSHRLSGEGGSFFPAYIGPGIEPAATRHAWCYGDPGIAAVLLHAGRSFGRPDWEDEAVAVARLAARRRGPDGGVVDPGICHGAAGLGHVFHRLYRATGEEELRDAALCWFERTLEMRRRGQGPGGFWRAGAIAENRPWTEEHGLLTGAAGIGLTLLAALTPIEPEWDRLLLLSPI